MSVCCECCVLSGRGLRDELITRPEESYRLWRVIVCDQENLVNEEAMVREGPQRPEKKKYRHRNSMLTVTQDHTVNTERPIIDGADIHDINNYKFPVAFSVMGPDFLLVPLSSDNLNLCSVLRKKQH
jgi:hypothetical protein